MARRRRPAKRTILPDPKYGNIVVSKFINSMMIEGKKGVAERAFYKALELIGQRTQKDPIEVFINSLENVKPVVEVKARRGGGATYQVPVEIRPERRQALAIRWIITHSRNRNEKTMFQKLAGELLDAFNNTGTSIKKKEDTHKMAEANKAFAHYKW